MRTSKILIAFISTITAIAPNTVSSSVEGTTLEELRSVRAYKAEAELQYKYVEVLAGRNKSVSVSGLTDVVKHARDASIDVGIDQSLILSIIEQESGFNPFAKRGEAEGLTQVIPKFHKEEVEEHGGKEKLSDVRSSIYVGAKVFKKYLKISKGSTTQALQQYKGNAKDKNNTYASQVLARKSSIDAYLKTQKGLSVVLHVPKTVSHTRSRKLRG